MRCMDTRAACSICRAGPGELLLPGPIHGPLSALTNLSLPYLMPRSNLADSLNQLDLSRNNISGDLSVLGKTKLMVAQVGASAFSNLPIRHQVLKWARDLDRAQVILSGPDKITGWEMFYDVMMHQGAGLMCRP